MLEAFNNATNLGHNVVSLALVFARRIQRHHLILAVTGRARTSVRVLRRRQRLELTAELGLLLLSGERRSRNVRLELLE